MSKPDTIGGYSDAHTVACERVLVTLLRGLGPWKDSIYLIGGLTPRYLVPARPPVVPPHAGTLDVDLVIDLQLLSRTDAYRTLEDNLKGLGFERAENAQGQKLSWRWRVRTERGAWMVIELLADDPALAGGRVQELPTDGTLSALNIPHASIVEDHHLVTAIRAELLDDRGVATESVRHADLVSFTCLKALAYDQRFERKDAHDLVYCLEYAPQDLDTTAHQFRQALAGRHADVVRRTIRILSDRFASDADTEGYRKDGPVSVAEFELGRDRDPARREARVLRQREANEVIEQLLARLR